MVAVVVRRRHEVQTVDRPDVGVVIPVDFFSSAPFHPFIPQDGHLQMRTSLWCWVEGGT